MFRVDVPYFISIMSRFLLLAITSIWARTSCSASILEPSVSDGISLSSDTSNPFGPGMSILHSKSAAIDTETKVFANAELIPAYECVSYNVPSKAKSRTRRCNPSNLGAISEDGTRTQPEAHGCRDSQTLNEELNTPQSDQCEAEPEEESSGPPANVKTKNPWDECKKYLNGILTYAVCDDPDPRYAIYSPLPVVYLNAPFWTLLYCTLGRLIHHNAIRMIVAL